MGKSHSLQLAILPGGFRIHRFAPDADLPPDVLDAGFVNICRTEEELSIVCADTIRLDSPRSETGWSCIQVAGPLDFSLTGILADLARILADAGISIFAMSTFDTDYLLVPSQKLDLARTALEAGGHVFT